ncbi:MULTISPECIES: alpha/beta hydrolase domain-containing protein [unclassified Streptomyces]|uniref:alpha/beta hydrolase domain-containing protein n=1 Tax=unclassified Streptomyces TaxID=2593676 RepID=UPI002365F630|nr:MULTISPECIES: alpha/beta hydrolase domain-containing protein [unclassified Streptomyces]MDF3141372.1 alpha/beta hydrolase domain-containing protein [Streptomyces sp. T21Q-yed]WDF38849.1 alpha/beta hydrolase domain-containing protein [Streptomyces sp. T12]
MKRRRLLALVLGTCLAVPAAAAMATGTTPAPAGEERSSRITDVQVTRKESLGTFGGRPYERLAGTVSGLVSGKEHVAGLDSVAGTDGDHTYTSGFELIRPVGQDDRSEVVVEAENRGMPLLLHGYNSMQDAPPTGAPQDVSYSPGMGDGFLFDEGRSYARVQWQTGISPGVPESAQGVGQVIVRDFGRLLRTGWLDGADSPLGAYEHRLLVGLSQASWFVTSFVAEGFNDAGGRVFQGAYAQDGAGNQLAINGVAAADGEPQVPYVRPDGVPLTPEQVLRRPATDPVFVDVAAYTDYYRLRAGISRQADPVHNYYRYDWPAAHNPVLSAASADIAFQQFGCNNGNPIPLNPLHSQPYGRALLVALERRLGIGGPRGTMPPEQLVTAGARPADPALLNGLPGREVTVPQTNADGFPIGGVRFPAADLPLGSPIPPAVAPVSTASITAVCGNYGGWQPYTAEELRRRYGSLDDYLSAYDARVTSLIGSGLLLERDRKTLLDRAAHEWSKAPTKS